jgi:hypothetical protein
VERGPTPVSDVYSLEIQDSDEFRLLDDQETPGYAQRATLFLYLPTTSLKLNLLMKTNAGERPSLISIRARPKPPELPS